ncbi:hypothetical protein ACWENQ_28315 [Nonomuraea sp. NPDC004354]
MSLSPNVAIAHSLAGAGARSTNASPTATTGNDPGPTSAATRYPTPSATAPATSPTTAAAHAGTALPLSTLSTGKRYARPGAGDLT